MNKSSHYHFTPGVKQFQLILLLFCAFLSFFYLQAVVFAFTRQLKVKLKLQPGGAINVNAPWVLWASGRGDDEGGGGHRYGERDGEAEAASMQTQTGERMLKLKMRCTGCLHNESRLCEWSVECLLYCGVING